MSVLTGRIPKELYQTVQDLLQLYAGVSWISLTSLDRYENNLPIYPLGGDFPGQDILRAIAEHKEKLAQNERQSFQTTIEPLESLAKRFLLPRSAVWLIVERFEHGVHDQLTQFISEFFTAYLKLENSVCDSVFSDKVASGYEIHLTYVDNAEAARTV